MKVKESQQLKFLTPYMLIIEMQHHYYKLVDEFGMGRVCYGPSLYIYGPSLSWAEFVMGRVV